MSTAALLILAGRLRAQARAARPHGPCRAVVRRGQAGLSPSSDSLSGRGAAQMADTGARASTARARISFRFARILTGLPMLLVVATCPGSVAHGQTAGVPAKPPAIIGGDAPRPTGDGPCVTVDIGGYRAGHLDCASRRLEAAARVAQAQARAGIETPVIDATSPDVRTGVANQTATRQRMGNTFGTSVYPQRPDRPPPVPRPGGRP